MLAEHTPCIAVLLDCCHVTPETSQFYLQNKTIKGCGHSESTQLTDLDLDIFVTEDWSNSLTVHQSGNKTSAVGQLCLISNAACLLQQYRIMMDLHSTIAKTLFNITHPTVQNLGSVHV